MDKSPEAFRTISEVAEALETPAHVLRFWESRFPQIRPVKRAGGRRYYRPADVALLTGIKRLLHDEGMTIRGVQKILREQGIRHVSGIGDDLSPEEEALEAAMAGRYDDEPGLSAELVEDETAAALEAALDDKRGVVLPFAPPEAAEEPVAVEAIEEPVAEEAVVEEPAAAEPLVEASPAGELAAQAPSADEDEDEAEEPAAELLAEISPAEEAITEEPGAAELVADAPAEAPPVEEPMAETSPAEEAVAEAPADTVLLLDTSLVEISPAEEVLAKKAAAEPVVEMSPAIEPEAELTDAVGEEALEWLAQLADDEIFAEAEESSVEVEVTPAEESAVEAVAPPAEELSVADLPDEEPSIDESLADEPLAEEPQVAPPPAAEGPSQRDFFDAPPPPPPPPPPPGGSPEPAIAEDTATLAARLRALPRGSMAGKAEALAGIAARISALRERMGNQPPPG